ncbi:methyltransferase family protein [Caballeronia sp. KNU42]
MKSIIPVPTGRPVVPRNFIRPPAWKSVSLTRDQLLAEIAMRLLAVVVFSMFVSSTISQFHKDPSRITLLLLAFSELLTLALAVCTRVPRERDWRPATVVIATCASFYFLAFRIEPGIHLIPESVAAGLQIAGVVIQLSAKIALRRSFGILPANRGVVVSGPYRFSRHPIYLGYFVNQIGFLSSDFGVQNLAVVLLLWGLQIYRVVREERVLNKDVRYREYAARVRYRFVPGVF